MVLRPIEPAARRSDDFRPAWDTVMRLQKQPYTECWMITQPSHAALAGQLASRLVAPEFPQLDPDLVRAIALHDSGWGMPDAQAVMSSRSVTSNRPRSFLEMSVADFLNAWKQSIEIVHAGSATGGYMVSRHFWRLAMHWLKVNGGPSADRELMQSFLDVESKRQGRLSRKQERSEQALEALTDVLQFCDLLSLYLCSGARDNVEFPSYCGVKARLTFTDDGYRLQLGLLQPGSNFKVASLRHPATKELSGQEIEIKIE